MTEVDMNGSIIDDAALDDNGLGGTPFRGPHGMFSFAGPFEISSDAYRLKLPKNMPIHNVFHVQLLSP
jgi:hypothetical protein